MKLVQSRWARRAVRPTGVSCVVRPRGAASLLVGDTEEETWRVEPSLPGSFQRVRDIEAGLPEWILTSWRLF